jgi:hypothetical protein
MFDSLAIRRIKLAKENGLTSDTVKIFNEPIKETIPFLGYYLYPLTGKNFDRYWSSQEKKDRATEITYLSWKLGLYKPKKLTVSEKEEFEKRDNNFNAKFNEETELLERFKRIVETLNKIKPLQSENPVIYGEKAYCEPRIKVGNTLEKVDQQDWLEILDAAQLSATIPLIYGSIPVSASPYTVAGFNIKYENKLLGLVWDQLSDLNLIPEAYRIYDSIDKEVLINIRKKIRPNETIKKERLFAFVNADKIYKCTYELNEGKLYFQYPEDGTDIMALLAITFPNLKLGEPKEIGFRFTFKIYGLNLNNVSFIQMIRTDDLMSNFLHLKENIKALPEMEKPSFIFTGFADDREIKININPLTGTEDTVELIVMADNPGVVENFRNIFTRLMKYYLDQRDDVLTELNKYLVALPANFKPQPPRFRKYTFEIDENIRQLPLHRRPVILEQESKDYNYILKFPRKGETRFYFSCADDIYAFPSLKLDLRTNKQVPYCRRIEELTPEEVKFFNVEYPEIIEESKSRKKIISGDKELSVNFLGYVDPNLIKLLQPPMLTLGSSEDNQILRMGNVPGFDSLIGCILLAVNDPVMKELTAVTIVRNIRREMALNINPIVCKQENYLDSLNDIKLNLLDVDTELESKRYFRALEVFFQINIFIWERSDGLINFEIPNGKFFHVRRFNTNWPSILIYRHNPRDPRKNEMDSQYQLLIYYDKNNNSSIRIFGKEVTDYLIIAYYTSYQISIWNSGKIKINPFISDYIKGGNPLGQILDGYGKCRGLVFNDYTLITPPVAPYNLSETSVQLANWSDLGKFGNPSAVSLVNNLLVGLWFKDLYCPCFSVVLPKEFDKLPQIKPGWLSNNINTSANNFNVIYRNLRVLMTIIRWLNRTDPKEFENFRTSGKIIIGNVNYKINNMGRRLPKLDNFDEALTYIKDKFIGLVQGDNIVIPSKLVLEHLDQVLQRANEDWRKLPKSIPNFYLYSSDFSNTLLFSLPSLDLALFGSEIVKTSTILPEEFGPSPVILKDENQMYLYYPRIGDNKLLTYNLFVKLRGLRVGYDEVKDSYILYQVSEERKLAPIENHVQGKQFLTLIEDGVIVPLL